MKLSGVVRIIELDFDGLRGGDQIADQVFQDVSEFDIDAGFGAFDFVAQLAGYFLHAAVALGLQLDKEVAGIGFGDGEGQAGSGAAGVALDFRRLADELLDVPQDAVGLNQAVPAGID